MTSAAVSTPDVAASEAAVRLRKVAIHARGRWLSSELDSVTPGSTDSVLMSMRGCRKRLNSTRPSAPASISRNAKLPTLEKCGDSFTATGTSTAPVTASTI